MFRNQTFVQSGSESSGSERPEMSSWTTTSRIAAVGTASRAPRIPSRELPIIKAAQMELVEVVRPNAIDALKAFCDGPVPFCSDGF